MHVIGALNPNFNNINFVTTFNFSSKVIARNLIYDLFKINTVQQ